MGNCNIALAHRGGWDTTFLQARVWVPEARAFMDQDVAYPAREASDAEESERSGGHRQVALQPYLPFGNVSFRYGPVVPNGALYPACALAPNESNALAQQTRSRVAVPYLLD